MSHVSIISLLHLGKNKTLKEKGKKKKLTRAVGRMKKGKDRY